MLSPADWEEFSAVLATTMSPPRLLLSSALLALGVAANPLAGKTLAVTTALVRSAPEGQTELK